MTDGMIPVPCRELHKTVCAARQKVGKALPRVHLDCTWDLGWFCFMDLQEFNQGVRNVILETSINPSA